MTKSHIARAVRIVSSVLTLVFGSASGVVYSQTAPTVISPLTAAKDLNNVNLTDGMVTFDLPSLSIPAAPRLNFTLIQNAIPYLVANMNGSGDAVLTGISVHSGASTSESFKCNTSFVCRNVKMDGAVIEGDIDLGGPYSFTESSSGAVYNFNQLISDVTTNQLSRQILYYASRITYPDGEYISFTYETANYSNGSLPLQVRLTRMTSSLGYYVSFEYQSSDVNQNAWKALAQATLYKASASTVPLQQLSYSTSGTITDLAGRVYNCSGCINRIGGSVEWSSVALTLPSESAAQQTVTGFQAIPNNYAYPAIVSSVNRDGVNWAYAYANFRSSTGSPNYSYDNVIVSGPTGYSQRYNILTGVNGQPNLISSVVDSIGRTTSYVYDTNSRTTRATYPEGNFVQVDYDIYGNITSKVSQPKAASGLAAISESAAIDATACSQTRVLCFRPTTYIDGLGRQTDYAYDSAGRLIQQTDPPDGTGIRRVKYLTYAGGGMGPNLVRICGLGTTCGTTSEIQTQYTYWSGTALPASETRVDGVTGVSLTTSYAYDNAGRLLSEDGPLAGTADAKYFTYDVIGRKIFEVGPANLDGTRPATRYTYRASDDKVISVESGNVPSASSTTLIVTSRVDTTYDGRRNPTQLATSSGGTTYIVSSGSFDDRGQQICGTIRMNQAVFGSLPADACMLGTAGTNGPDRITRSTYDAAGQLTLIQKAYGTSLQQNYASYTYSPNGKQTSVTDANGNLANLAYDGFDRLSKWTFPSKTVAGQVNAADFESYGYDAVGNRLTLRKRDGVTIAYQYDGLNRVTLKTVPTSATGAAGYSVYQGYDVRGLQTYARFGSTTGAGVVDSYDGFGRQKSSTTTMSGTGRTIAYQYDSAGNRTQVLHPDGAHFDYQFDAGNRMGAGYWTGPSGYAAQHLNINYDGLGRRTSTMVFLSTTAYSYDPISRLQSSVHYFNMGSGDWNTTFGYNPASQITSQTRNDDALIWTSALAVTRNYAVNGLNQYTSAGPAIFGYDANGNLTSDGTNAFVYDAENRLVRATRGAVTVTLAYDPMGRLWQTSGGASGTTQFVYDGDHVALEYDGATSVRRRYAWGPGADEPLLQDEGGAMNCTGTRFLHADHQGSIIGTADCTGMRSSINTYDEYGIPGPANWGRFQYTGQAWLSDIGLYYYKARMYSPTLGRFLQTDPIGYDDQINLYAYVANDPVNRSDPSGKAAVLAIPVADFVFVAGACYLSGVCETLSEAFAKGYDAAKQIFNNEEAAPPAPTPPNPDGSKGGAAHQGKIKERIEGLKEQGKTHDAGGDKPEERVDTPGGEKGSRRPDITMTNPDGSKYRENVGRQNQDGSPVARERRAQDDIKRTTGQCDFTAYNCK